MMRYCSEISAEEYRTLRADVGWPPLETEQAQSLLDHADFLIACRDERGAVGFARVFWDKGYIAYLADVMVKPAYQGQGIGERLVSACIRYVDEQLKAGWRIKIVIVAAQGKERFYEKLGFRARPNETEGAGMNMWREWEAGDESPAADEAPIAPAKA